jgi:hypothetical protein
MNTDVQNLANVMSVEKLHELAVTKYGYEHKSAGEEDREAIVQHIENYKNPDHEFIMLNEVPEELQEEFDQWLFNIKDSESLIPSRSDRRKTSMQFYYTDLDRITRVGQHLREIKTHLNPNPFMVHISFGVIFQAGNRIEGKKPYQGNYANMFNSDKNGAVPIHNQADFRNLINNITADTLRERFSSPGSDIKVLAVVSMYVEVYRLNGLLGCYVDDPTLLSLSATENITIWNKKEEKDHQLCVLFCIAAFKEDGVFNKDQRWIQKAKDLYEAFYLTSYTPDFEGVGELDLELMQDAWEFR